MKRKYPYALRTARTTLILLLGLALQVPSADAIRELTDLGIITAVEAELVADNQVTANAIDVESRDGVVTLSGTVETLRDKDRATELTSVIVGVRSIVNRIEVKPLNAPSDRALAGRVRTALKRDPVTEFYEIAASAAGGSVALTGVVDSFQEKELAGDIARSIEGVTTVDNRIEVSLKEKRSDEELRADIRSRLRSDVRLDEGRIEIAVSNGSVTLSGSVGSLQEKNRAYGLAWVAGTREVETNGLDISWTAADPLEREDDPIHREDDELKASIEDALLYDPRVPAARVEVHVATGIATLRGVVDNLRAKKAAEQDARLTPGIWRVVNNLKVRPAIPDRKTLKQRVAEKLKHDSLIDREAISLTVDNGWVTLEGRVSTSYEKYQTELAVRAVKGVVGVHNELDFSHQWNWRPDTDLRDAVEEQLFWSALVEADDISVSVEAGVVTLTGTVTSQSEKEVAEKNAYQGGAKHVENRIEVARPDLRGPLGPTYFNPAWRGGYSTWYWW